MQHIMQATDYVHKHFGTLEPQHPSALKSTLTSLWLVYSLDISIRHGSYAVEDAIAVSMSGGER